jgi:Ribbon-helix-helix protein, copG family
VRTTLTLDDDVAKLLDKEVRKSGNSFKQVVNHFLRLGLTAKPLARRPFKVKPWNLGLPPFEKVEELLDWLEGPDHR